MQIPRHLHFRNDEKHPAPTTKHQLVSDITLAAI
jgi:hypothetical protein